jgi:putative hydrolase of the HAD superfamily
VDKPPTALFWDIGGVLLSNAWDHSIRRRAVEHFQLDPEQFEALHEQFDAALETGKISLDDYLDRTVFELPRLFSKQEFRDWMLSQSTPKPDSLDLVRRVARSNMCLMAALNNESRELNEFRISTFGLRDILDVFLTSCYLGLRKPDPGFYRLAMEISQRAPDECVFIDDRPPNVDAARGCGMRTIQFESAGQLRQSLQTIGIQV